jgi:hypothetical protein
MNKNRAHFVAPGLAAGSIALVAGSIALALLLAFAPTAQACSYSFNPENPRGMTGQEISIEVKLVWMHRTCELGDQDVKLEAKGVEILSHTPWTKTGKGVFVSTLKVKLGSPGQGKLRVFRVCSKEHTTEASATITIDPA